MKNFWFITITMPASKSWLRAKAVGLLSSSAGWGRPSMEPMEMCYNAISCILWEIGTAAVVCLAVNVTVIVFPSERQCA